MNLNRRNLSIGGILALAAIGGGVAYACSDDDLEKAIEEYRKAMVDGNGARLLELSADDMSFGHANAVVQTKTEFVSTVVKKEEIFKRIDLSNHKIHVMGDLAIARHVFDADLVFQGKELQLKLDIVQMWKNEDGRWRLLLRQSFKPITV